MFLFRYRFRFRIDNQVRVFFFCFRLDTFQPFVREPVPFTIPQDAVRNQIFPSAMIIIYHLNLTGFEAESDWN